MDPARGGRAGKWEEPLFPDETSDQVPTDDAAADNDGPAHYGLPIHATGPLSAEGRAVSGQSTLVIEGDVIPRRLRRPADLMRFALVVIAAAIALPVAAAIDLLVRRRGRQLIEAVAVLALTVTVVWLLAWWIQQVESAQLLIALTGRPDATTVMPLNPILSGIIAFITVARLVDKTRWAIASAGLVIAMFVANIVAGGITVAALTLSALIGWALGLIARYALGTPTTRPNGLEVASALEKSGFPLTVLRASHETAGGRRYSATTRVGERMEVLVLDRDLEGAGLLRGAWRQLRLRDEGGTSGFSMRSRLEHPALQSYATATLTARGEHCAHSTTRGSHTERSTPSTSCAIRMAGSGYSILRKDRSAPGILLNASMWPNSCARLRCSPTQTERLPQVAA